MLHRVSSAFTRWQCISAKALLDILCATPPVFVKEVYLVNGYDSGLDDSTSFGIKPKDMADLGIVLPDKDTAYVTVFRPHFSNPAHPKKQVLCTVVTVNSGTKSLVNFMFPPRLSVVYSREIYGHAFAPIVKVNVVSFQLVDLPKTFYYVAVTGVVEQFAHQFEFFHACFALFRCRSAWVKWKCSYLLHSAAQVIRNNLH
jgi:hypothetical protein